MTSQRRDDRRALRQYLATFSWAVHDYLGTPLRRLRADLRDQTVAAAAEVGMTQALADLGPARELAARYAEEHGRRGPRGARLVVRTVAALTAIALAVGAVVAVRALPRVDLDGGFGHSAGFVLTADPWAVTYVATDTPNGSEWAQVVIENPRSFPVTVTGVDSPVTEVVIVPTDVRTYLGPATTANPGSHSLVIPGHGLAVVRVRLFMPCADVTAGGGPATSVGSVVVSAFGIDRRIDLPLEGTFEVARTTDWAPSATCSLGEPG